MSLTSCKVCNGKVAVSAPACPHCGALTPGLSDEELQVAATRAGFFQARWVAGLAFWPGVAWLLWPVFTGGSGDDFLQRWQLSKFLIGFGVVWYVLSEIERNLFERKEQKRQRTGGGA